MKKVLFLDRDGTLIIEPKSDQQVDRFEKLRFLPGVIRNLGRIVRELDYELVMVTNQDGMGTSSFPEDSFWPVHNLMIQILLDEGIDFADVLIDRSFDYQNYPGRKPGIAMLKKYLKGPYDLDHSLVIGDRLTDVQLAKNLGAKAIFLNEGSEDVIELNDTIVLKSNNWDEIYHFLKIRERYGKVKRTTKETDILIEVSPDGKGLAAISTGIGFFDHMLQQLVSHGNLDLMIQANGDLHIDKHHTIEDVGIALGSAIYLALGKKVGMQRFGFSLPMDEAAATVVLDFSGRPFFKWRFKATETEVGGIPVTLFEHFFRSFSDTAKCNLHVKAKGSNTHHTIEAVFKAFAKALRMAFERDFTDERLPSTKGSL